MTDEERGDAALLRDAQQPCRGLADLRDRARRRADLLRPERLHRVDHADRGAFGLQRRADRVELGLGQDLDRVAAAEPRGAELHLRDRLLAGDEQRAPVRRDRAERHQEKRRLADPGLAADEDERCGHEAAAEHPVELGTPVEMRGSPRRRRRRGAAAARRPPPARRAPGASATSVPNSPQPGHRPSQRPDEVPHSVQTCWRVAAFAMGKHGTPHPGRNRYDFDMRLRQLGDSDLQVSEISLGSWLTYGGGVDDDQAEACVAAAFEAGINFIDTANIYATGGAEEFLGNVLQSRPRDSYVLATKLLLRDGTTTTRASRGSRSSSRSTTRSPGCAPTTSTSTSATATTTTHRSTRQWRR